jgi:hypothetical protein
MKFVSKRLTYANVMSSIAVFLVLAGGTAFAANQLGKNTVGSKQLKSNAVTAAKIKNEAVTGAKVKKGSLTGTDINLGTLGTVPNATHADSANSATTAGHASSADTATNATNATNAVNATNFSRYATTGLKSANVGAVVTLATIGPFTIKGHCESTGADLDAYETIETSAAGSFLYAHSSYQEANFNPGTEVEIGENAEDSTPYWSDYYDDDDTGWVAASPDGSLILKGLAVGGVHVFGNPCSYMVTWINNA